MDTVSINNVAVLVAAIANMVLGSLWYSPILFGKKWMELTGMRMEDMGKKEGVWKAYAGTFAGALVMAYVLAHIVDFAEAATWLHGVQAGFWCWLGFVMTTSMASVFFEGREWGLYFISNAYYLLAMMIMGVILTLWV